MFFIDIWTKKCYKNLSNYTLSERFQIAENMRVARIMKRSIFLITLGNLIIFPVGSDLDLEKTNTISTIKKKSIILTVVIPD